MTNLNSRSALHPRWTKAPLRVLESFEACVIAIYEPNIGGASARDWNPLDGPGATAAPTLLWQGPAQLQVYRQSLTVDDVAGSVTQLRSIRITLPLETPVMVHKGLMIRVVDSDLNPEAKQYEYIVTSGMTSPLAFKMVIEAEADQAVVVDPIGP